MSTTHALIILSVVLALGVVLVLAAALIEIRHRLVSISEGLAALGSALSGVQSQHLRPLESAVHAINTQFDAILRVLPGIASKAAVVAGRRSR